MRKQFKRLSIEAGLLITVSFFVIAVLFLVTEFSLIQNNAIQAASELAQIYSTDENLIDGIKSNEDDLDKYIGPSFYTSERISYFAIYDLNKTLLASSSKYDESALCEEGSLALSGEEAVCSPELFEKDRLQVVVPIENDSEPLGVFLVGVDADSLWSQKVHSAERILFITAIGIIVSWGGVVVFSKRSQGRLLGFEPNEIALLYSENKSLIDQLEQAVISVDVSCRITTINPTALHMFSLSKEDVGKDLRVVFPYVSLGEIIHNQEHLEDEYIEIKQHKLIMNVYTLYQGTNVIGATVIFRSYLDVDTMVNQIKGYRQLSEALRSQKHEFQNKLHVILGLIKMNDYEKATQYITENVYKTNLASDYYSSRLKDDRVLALFIGKEIQCKEKSVHLLLTSDSFLGKDHTPIPSDDIVLVLGNLIDNSFDAYENTDSVDKKIVVDIIEDDEQLMITVIDQAGGIDPKVIDHIFERGVSTKIGGTRGTGLSLVNEIIRIYDGEKNVKSSLEETKIEIILSKVKL